MKKFINQLPFSLLPVFFATSFVLVEFNAAISELYLHSVFWPIVIFSAFAWVIFALSIFFLKDSVKAEVFSAILLIPFLLFGAVVSLNWDFYFSVGNYALGKDRLLLLVWLGFCFWAFFTIKRTKKNLSAIVKFLFRVSLAAIIVPALLITIYVVKRSALPPARSPLAMPKALPAIDKNSLPDIYFILPEDYSAPAVFKEYFHFDESSFVNFLKTTGFFVANSATSNYPKSFLSLASILNLEYLDYLSVYKNSSDMSVVNPLIDNNNVMKFLRMFGYKYYQLGSWWDPTKFNPSADENFTLENSNRIGLDPFIYDLLDTTALSPFLNELIPEVVIGDSDDDNRQRILYQFDKLSKIVSLPSPKFVFAHIIAPHGPYVFAKDCRFVSESQTSQKTEVENYVDQTNCINQKLEASIKTIIATSQKPPVIVLVTDEGAPFLGKQFPTGWDDWKTASTALLREKFPILAAYYLPGVPTGSLYPSISAVNSFREVFNLYFHAAFPILPDRNFIFQDLSNLYQFTDVTQKVK